MFGFVEEKIEIFASNYYTVLSAKTWIW